MTHGAIGARWPTFEDAMRDATLTNKMTGLAYCVLWQPDQDFYYVLEESFFERFKNRVGERLRGTVSSRGEIDTTPLGE